MFKAKLAGRITELAADRTPFVLATVVAARRPTSVRLGDSAIVLSDGTIDGFVGGQCAESSVRLYSIRALETGEPVLLRLVPGQAAGAEHPDPVDGAVIEHNPCLSGGTLEIFLEPQLPASRIVVVGGSPIAEALADVAAAAGYDALRVRATESSELDGAAAVVVASHGKEEEAILAAALEAGVPYVGLVASPKRGTAVRGSLEVPEELAAQLHTPAGLDIGARTPAEIAVSILAELVAEHHADPVPGPSARPVEAVDPVCGMTVMAMETTLHLDVGDRRFYFCGAGCRDAYAALHAGDTASG